jgi:cholesterol oxidase
MKHTQDIHFDYDYIIIGSGFGGAVSALRLSEKGYKVLVVEKGKWYRQQDFARTNWQFAKWLWLPSLRWFGIMKITIFKDVGIVSGTGVGGGSLVYANTLPIPKTPFFNSGSWAGLADWQRELQPFYQQALRMLGAARNPSFFDGEHALETLAKDIGQEAHLDATEVGVYFGENGKTVPDPYFDGQGPDRTGCRFCGACMTGCRHNAKNSLDKNYLYLAQRHGAKIIAEQEVVEVIPLDGAAGASGYEVVLQPSTRFFKPKKSLRAKGVVFAGGVLGTVKLLLKLRQTSLPGLSPMAGKQVRTNNESLICVTQLDNSSDMSEGIAIGAILHTDEHSHLEICRYGAGSGAWRLSFLPFVEGPNMVARFLKMIRDVVLHPGTYWRYLRVKDWAKSTLVMLFMQTLDITVTFTRTRRGGMRTAVVGDEKPTAFIPRAIELARKFEKIMHGKAMAFGLTPLMGIPGTAHILGGAVMGASPETGVIDSDNRVFGYDNLLVCDGSMISANPGVNPALSITAIAERAMSKVEVKQESII